MSLDTRLDVVFSPTLSLRLFAQPLVSAGEFTRYRQLARPSTFDLLDFPDGVTDVAFTDRSFTVRSLRGSAVLRWEYRPGSRIYLAWQQSRQDRAPFGALEIDRDVRALFSAPGEHFIMVKLDYWLDS